MKDTDGVETDFFFGKKILRTRIRLIPGEDSKTQDERGSKISIVVVENKTSFFEDVPDVERRWQ
jgi:hypothetical protein